jgi:hypothetical protein
MRRKRAAAITVGLLVGWAAFPAPGLEVETWRANYPFAGLSRLVVENVQGSISVEGWDGNEVEMTVVLTAAEEGGRVRVVVDREPDSLHLRTVHPRPLASAEAAVPVQVDYTVRVPRQAEVELRTVLGEIVVRNLEGAVDVRSVEGSIESTGLRGPAVARTVHGDIRAQWTRLPEPAEEIRLETLHGSVSLELPPRPQADLEVSTVSGQLTSPYLFTAAQAGSSGGRVRLGRGGPRIWLRTVRGDILMTEEDDQL